MKIIKYDFYKEENIGTQEEPVLHAYTYPVQLPWSEENEAIAKAEARDGQYVIEEDGTAEMPKSSAERIAALEARLDGYEAAYAEGVQDA